MRMIKYIKYEILGLTFQSVTFYEIISVKAPSSFFWTSFMKGILGSTINLSSSKVVAGSICFFILFLGHLDFLNRRNGREVVFRLIKLTDSNS